ncbi:MAG: hypothetical protein IPN87_15340 [Saprospiraceae bacterium]|jgi:hypothetical protein|uniref:hypothetical protein n=1 Tax=Candidatus Brachybacter algidus TaxID=2982024 RepID=UPI001B455C50|nr:hypothetical protein [Candidatus Brachybacter algidus]MBP7306824.1 hypothetical protein [Saprospiraceae bacterium]MBK6449294.1 hypothetical protein [Candidatus Brachybacter algidus]MBK7602277.1 hypothetical protein [Candidatus Brachybacter algidus]MBK8604362.1 hypothetical protein [Candidatus Brachybacter algidus]MBK8843959.1 hypothetical protein [Candidatus Brachybacter algidus]
MKIIAFKFISLSILYFFMLAQASGQVVEKNKSGELIVVFDDGSWRYYEDSDSILLKAAEPLKESRNQSDAISEQVIETMPLDNNSNQSQKSESKKAKNDSNKKGSNTKAVKVVDVMMNPPEYKCNVIFAGTDEYTKKKRIDLQKEILFDYTDPEVATYLKGRSYVTCEANFVEFIGDIRILTLKITVASRMARAEYGYLNSNTLMSVKMLNGETVTLFSNGSDVGQVDNNNNLTVYKANFPVTRENQKTLMNSLVDKIKIVWSTGYEEYSVTNIDFFSNQIRCLDNQ